MAPKRKDRRPNPLVVAKAIKKTHKRRLQLETKKDKLEKFIAPLPSKKAVLERDVQQLRKELEANENAKAYLAQYEQQIQDPDYQLARLFRSKDIALTRTVQSHKKNIAKLQKVQEKLHMLAEEEKEIEAKRLKCGFDEKLGVDNLLRLLEKDFDSSDDEEMDEI